MISKEFQGLPRILKDFQGFLRISVDLYDWSFPYHRNMWEGPCL